MALSEEAGGRLNCHAINASVRDATLLEPPIEQL
jgi:hypothetical protein